MQRTQQEERRLIFLKSELVVSKARVTSCTLYPKPAGTSSNCTNLLSAAVMQPQVFVLA